MCPCGFPTSSRSQLAQIIRAFLLVEECGCTFVQRDDKEILYTHLLHNIDELPQHVQDVAIRDGGHHGAVDGHSLDSFTQLWLVSAVDRPLFVWFDDQAQRACAIHPVVACHLQQRLGSVRAALARS